MLILLLMMTATVHAADTTRLCMYNVLNYSATNEDGRIPNYALIMGEIQPDLLVCCEVDDATMGPRFIADVLTYAPFAASPFLDGPDSDVQLLYDQNKFTFLGQRRFSTELRNIAEFTLLHKPSNGLTSDTVVLYGMHLKASEGFEDQRSQEIDSLLKYMTANTFIAVCGDLNVYAPQEPAYTKILARPMIDPLGTVWQRNTASNARFYTQCTREDQVPSCGGGVSGGLDDRFDFIIMSQRMHERYVDGSYVHFGNDGQPRLNSSIIDPPNTIVSSDMSNALLCASDHLPIYADFVLGDVQASVDNEDSPLFTVRYDGTQIIVTDCTPGELIAINNIEGHTMYVSAASDTTMFIGSSTMPSGFYVVRHGRSSAGIAIMR